MDFTRWKVGGLFPQSKTENPHSFAASNDEVNTEGMEIRLEIARICGGRKPGSATGIE